MTTGFNIADYVYYDESSPTLLRRSPNKLTAKGMWRAHQPIGRAISGQGYRPVVIHGLGNFYAHRLVWELHHGPIPDGMVIDHKDRDRTNNRISNLRCVTQAVNSANSHSRLNKHGHTGVSYDPRDKRYYAKINITVNGKRKQIMLGNYATAKEAGEAYSAKKKDMYPCIDTYTNSKYFEPGLASLLMFS